MGISLGGSILNSVFGNQAYFTQQQIEALERQRAMHEAYAQRQQQAFEGFVKMHPSEVDRGNLKVIDGECVEVIAEEPKLLEYKPK